MTSQFESSGGGFLSNLTEQPPGWRWMVFLGAIGFSAGFFGPMIFVPESNQGPMVGIFITGPGGVLLGAFLWVLMKLMPLPARGQWILLTGLGLIGTVVTLLVVQPEPARLGDIVEIEVIAKRTPTQAADEVVAGWRKRFVAVTWATPRVGWEAEMRSTLAQDGGLVIAATLVRRRRIMEHRKPWNRGQLFASGWEIVLESRSYYVPAEQLTAIREGGKVQLFIANDSLGGVSAPDAWPPSEFQSVIGMSVAVAVPVAYDRFR